MFATYFEWRSHDARCETPGSGRCTVSWSKCVTMFRVCYLQCWFHLQPPWAIMNWTTPWAIDAKQLFGMFCLWYLSECHHFGMRIHHELLLYVSLQPNSGMMDEQATGPCILVAYGCNFYSISWFSSTQLQLFQLCQGSLHGTLRSCLYTYHLAMLGLPLNDPKVDFRLHLYNFGWKSMNPSSFFSQKKRFRYYR